MKHTCIRDDGGTPNRRCYACEEEKKVMKPFILTYTGKHVNPLDLRPEDICIEDIAHALALCNRFAGHTKKGISVAQHSVYVSRLCDEIDALQGLLHDGAEAYLSDMTKWLKSTPEMRAYREAEDRAQTVIYDKFGCVVEMSEQVKVADTLMLRFEGVQGYGEPKWKKWRESLPSNYGPLTNDELKRIGKWSFWSWHAAEEVFLATFRTLTT